MSYLYYALLGCLAFGIACTNQSGEPVTDNVVSSVQVQTFYDASSEVSEVSQEAIQAYLQSIQTVVNRTSEMPAKRREIIESHNLTVGQFDRMRADSTCCEQEPFEVSENFRMAEKAVEVYADQLEERIRTDLAQADLNEDTFHSISETILDHPSLKDFFIEEMSLANMRFMGKSPEAWMDYCANVMYNQ